MIKSEKAYDIIHDNYPKYPCEGGDIGEICYETDDTVTCIDAAERAIVQAEFDARDRAVDAFEKFTSAALLANDFAFQFRNAGVNRQIFRDRIKAAEIDFLAALKAK